MISERVGLRRRPWEAVQDKAGTGVGLGEPCSNHPNHHSVWHKPTSLHLGVGGLSQHGFCSERERAVFLRWRLAVHSAHLAGEQPGCPCQRQAGRAVSDLVVRASGRRPLQRSSASVAGQHRGGLAASPRCHSPCMNAARLGEDRRAIRVVVVELVAGRSPVRQSSQRLGRLSQGAQLPRTQGGLGREGRHRRSVADELLDRRDHGSSLRRRRISQAIRSQPPGPSQHASRIRAECFHPCASRLLTTGTTCDTRAALWDRLLGLATSIPHSLSCGRETVSGVRFGDHRGSAVSMFRSHSIVSGICVPGIVSAVRFAATTAAGSVNCTEAGLLHNKFPSSSRCICRYLLDESAPAPSSESDGPTAAPYVYGRVCGRYGF